MSRMFTRLWAFVKSNHSTCILAIIIAIGSVWRAFSCLTKTLSADELRTIATFVPESVSNILFQPYWPNNLILLTLLIKASMSLFGDSDMAVRLPALLLSIAALGAIYALSKRLFGSWHHAALSTLFLSVSWLHILYSTAVRAYGAMVLFAILSAYFLDKTLRTGSIRAGIGFVLSCLLGALSHLFTLSLFVVWGAVVAWDTVLSVVKLRKGSRDGWRGVAVAAAALGVAVVAVLAIYQPSLSIVENVYHRVVHGSFTLDIFNTFDTGNFPSIASLATRLSGCRGAGVWVSHAVAVFGLAVMVRHRRRAAIMCLSGLVGIPLVMWITDVGFLIRFFIVLLPFYVLSLSSGVVKLSQLLSQMCLGIGADKFQNLTGLLLAGGMCAMMFPQAWREARREAFGDMGGPWAVKPAARFIANNAKPGDLVLAYPLDRERAPNTWFDREMPGSLQYYMAKLVWPKQKVALATDKVGLWYLTPRKGKLELEELPEAFKPELLTKFENVYVYHDEVGLVRGLREVPMPPAHFEDDASDDEPWTITYFNGSAEASWTPAGQEAQSEAVCSLRMIWDGTKFNLWSPVIPAVPRRLVVLCGYVQGDLRHCGMIIQFLDDSGEPVRSLACPFGWQEPEWAHYYMLEEPAGSGWYKQQLAGIVPSRATQMRIGFFVRDHGQPRHKVYGTSQGQEFKFRITSLRADW